MALDIPVSIHSLTIASVKSGAPELIVPFKRLYLRAVQVHRFLVFGRLPLYSQSPGDSVASIVNANLFSLFRPSGYAYTCIGLQKEGWEGQPVRSFAR